MTTKHLFVAVLLTAVLGTCVWAQGRVPKYADYAVTTIYNGRNAPVKLTKDDMAFRTRLRNAAKDKRNFAGEYIVAQWGCGAECLSTVVISARTGKIYDVPFSICCWNSEVDAVEFRLNSRLIVFRGIRNESEKDSENDTHFYEFTNGRFRFIKTIKPQ